MSKVIEFIRWERKFHHFLAKIVKKSEIVRIVLCLKQKKGGENVVGIGQSEQTNVF